MSIVRLRRTVRHLIRLIVTLVLTLGSLALTPYPPASAAPGVLHPERRSHCSSTIRAARMPRI